MPRPKDESYIIDLCNDIFQTEALRGHRFDFLRGDPDKRGTCHRLPVDAYYPAFNLVVEYHERQHSEAVSFFDRRIVASGITRGEQRRKYDDLRRDVLPKNGIHLVILTYQDFDHDAQKRLRRGESDRLVIAERLSQFIPCGRLDGTTFA